MNPEVLDGKKVVGAEGYILGEVDGIEVDTDSWRAHAFYVNLSDEATAELGFKKLFLRRIAVCLPTQLVKSIGEVLTLNEPIRSLEDISQKGIASSFAVVKGKKVVGAHGFVVGEVEGFDVDFNNWQVTGLQVGLTDEAATELGFKRPFFSRVVVIIPSEIVSEVGNFITLDERLEDVASIVECIRSCQRQERQE
jgi:sporulation protein YlmC with PRC-barrel domain